MDTAAKATSAIAQAILTNMPTGSHLSRGVKVADLECFNGSRDKAEQFLQSICIAVMMQLDMFEDDRMKILYALSFMCGGIAQVWAENETNAVLSHMSMFPILGELLSGVERTFSDLDQERMACTQLHALKMMTGMAANVYMAKFDEQAKESGKADGDFQAGQQ